MGIKESLLNTITAVSDSDFVRIVTSAGTSSKATVQNLFKSFESNLGAKSSLTVSDYIRVVGSDNVSYKQPIYSMCAPYSNPSGTDLLSVVKALNQGTYFYRMDSVSGFPVSGGVVYRIVKTHGAGDARASIIAVPMDANANIYTTFITSASASSITWTAQPTRAEVNALNSLISNTLVTDLNTLLSNHAVNVSIFAYGSSASNKPSGNSGVVITQASGNYRGQFVIDLGGAMFTRTYVNGTISAWVAK